MKHLKIKPILKHHLFPFFILLISMLLLHLCVPIPIADDIFYMNQSNNWFNWSFYIDRYSNWSSRLIIEFFVLGFLHLPSIIWRMINPLVIVLLAISISKLFTASNKYAMNWFVIFLLILFPYKEIMSAGWITMSLNYLWPISFGISSMIVIKKIIYEEDIHTHEYIISILLMFFSINHEIMCALLAVILFMAAIYLALKRRRHWFVYLGLILCVLSLIFILTSPGNLIRRVSETKWFIDFYNISLIEKLEIGLSSALAKYLFRFNFIFFIFSLLIVIFIWEKYQVGLYKVYSLIPFVNGLLYGNIIHAVTDRAFPYLALIDTEMTKYGIITLPNFTDIKSYIPFIILYGTSLIIYILLYLIFKNSWKSLLALGVLTLGICARVIVAFSPTVWASGERTYSFLFLSFIICTVMVLQELLNNRSYKSIENFFIITGFITFVSYLNLLMSA